MSKQSEFRSYPYIIECLKGLEWNTKHPKRGGEVYTQGEFRKHDNILHSALILDAPENIAIISWNGGYRYWVIEAKADHNELNKAVFEAKQYAEKINNYMKDSNDKIGLARFVTGIAGTPDETFYVNTQFWDGEKWSEVAINNYEATGFLSHEQCQSILAKNNPNLDIFEYSSEKFLIKANKINKTLYTNEIPVGDRAKIMAALLLALAQDGNFRIHTDPTRLIREINGLIEDILKQHGKEDFSDILKLALPATQKNHKKYRKAIIETLQHLREMNIRSAINSGDDALGKFYETFLKYANGAREMGIVLTPRHITRFAVDTVGVGQNDYIFDPACGTGGFLISAMESMRIKKKLEYNKFKTDRIYGIEQRDDVYGLAIVNMIFRGDGKSHIYDGNCFEHEFWKRDNEIKYSMNKIKPDGATKPFTRVLMNPPFKLESNKETEFVDYGLSQTADSGIMFAVLPHIAIKGQTYTLWRQQLMKRHTLLACIKFDKSLFYPIGEATYAVIIKAHVPHKIQNDVFMAALFDDNHRPRKSKRIAVHKAIDNVEKLSNELRRFLLGQPVENVDQEQILVNIDPKYNSGFSPETYLESSKNAINTSFRSIESKSAKLRVEAMAQEKTKPLIPDNFGTFPLKDFVIEQNVIEPKKLKDYQNGKIPVVTAQAPDNGIGAWLNIPEKYCFENCITVSLKHNTKPCQAFWHPYKFSALRNHAMVLRPIPELMIDTDAVVYLCEAITTKNSWRYHYARSVIFEELEVEIPIKSGEPDYEKMVNIVRSQTPDSIKS